MSQAIGIWCCESCTPKLENLLQKFDTTTEITKTKNYQGRIVISLNTQLDDFYHFNNGTKVKGQGALKSTEDSTIWKQQSIVATRLEEIILELELNEKEKKKTYDVEKTLSFLRQRKVNVEGSRTGSETI